MRASEREEGGMETRDHVGLKRMSVAFLRGLGCCAVGTEVACPIPRWRADVAGYSDGVRTGKKGEKRKPFTAIVECKQARADFLRDRADRASLMRQREELLRKLREEEERLLARVEGLVGEGEGGVAGCAVVGTEVAVAREFLFPQLEVLKDEAARWPGHRELVRELEGLDRRLYGHTKFALLSAYRQADVLYVAAPRGMVRADELPRGWGLVEGERVEGEGEEVCAFEVRVEAERLACAEGKRVRLLRNIAVRGSRNGLVH
ncbi:MAG: hypothetical protein AB7G17_04710 [Phycisphaerales bacterium]